MLILDFSKRTDLHVARAEVVTALVAVRSATDAIPSTDGAPL